MARCTAFSLDHRMFVNKRTGFVGVAFVANRVLRRGRPQLPCQKSTVRIVTVVALHEPFVHTVMKSSRELLFGLQMATVTKLRLLLLHEELTLLGMVRGMAVGAPDVVLKMRRARKVAVLLAVGMAPEAAVADLLRRGILERKYL